MSSSAAVRDEGTLEIPRALTHDFKVASIFIIVSVEVQIHVWVSYCLHWLQCIWDEANKEGVDTLIQKVSIKLFWAELNCCPLLDRWSKC